MVNTSITEGCRVRVLRGRHFPTFQERQEGVVLSADEECLNCTVRFDGRREAVLVAWKHLRVIEDAPPQAPSAAASRREERRQKPNLDKSDSGSEVEELEMANAAFAEAYEALYTELAVAQGEELRAELALARSEELQAQSQNETSELSFALSSHRRAETAMEELFSAELDEGLRAEAAREASLCSELKKFETGFGAQRRELEDHVCRLNAEIAQVSRDRVRQVDLLEERCAELQSRLAAARGDSIKAVAQQSLVDNLEARVTELEALNTLADARLSEEQSSRTGEERLVMDLRRKLRLSEEQQSLLVEASPCTAAPLAARSVASPHGDRLFQAVQEKDTDVLHRALEAKPREAEAALRARDAGTGETLLHSALAGEVDDAARFLLSKEKQLAEWKTHIHNLQGEQLEREARWFANSREATHGRTPLALLCHRREAPPRDIAISLLQCKADVTARDKAGITPFVECAQSGHLELAKLLVEATRGLVLLDADETMGRTALHWSAHHGHAHLTEFLLSVGMDRRAIDDAGATSMELAEAAGHVEVVEALRKAETASGSQCNSSQDGGEDPDSTEAASPFPGMGFGHMGGFVDPLSGNGHSSCTVEEVDDDFGAREQSDSDGAHPSAFMRSEDETQDLQSDVGCNRMIFSATDGSANAMSGNVASACVVEDLDDEYPADLDDLMSRHPTAFRAGFPN